MTFREKIILAPKETVHVRIDYMNLSKDRSFIMIAIHPTVFNIIINSITPRIAILVNSTDKLLKICKDIRLDIIHKFVETVYFMTNVSKVSTVLVVATIILIE